MKRSRIGQRPSDRKQRGAMMGLDDEQGEAPRRMPEYEQAEPPRRMPPVEPPRPPFRRAGAKKSGPMRSLFIAALVLAAAAAGAMLAFSGNIFALRVDHVEVQLGETIATAAPGETLDVAYAGGLICKRIVYKGLYRLFAPSSAVCMIEGVEQSANRFNEDLVPLLVPEQQLDYRLVITGGEQQNLGSVGIRLTMTAADWIARSEQVSEPSAQVVCLEKAIALDPDSQDARVALGRLYEGRGERAKAAQEYEAVVKINPDHAGAIRSLVRFYEGDRTKTARLIELYDRLARIDTGAADGLYFKAGELARKNGQTQSAIEMYRKALDANRGHIAARQQLIKLYDARKEWNRAAGNTVVLLEFEPKNADLRLFLSQMYMNMNNFDAALREAGQAARLRPGDAAVLLHQGMLAEKAKKPKDAIGFYKEALKIDKRNHAVCNNLAMLLEKQGNRKEAITWYRQAVALSPSNIGYHINLADAYEKNGQFKEAAAAYEALVARDKKNKKAWEALAVLQERAKNPHKALAAYQALSGLEPKNTVWLLKTAGLYEQTGNVAKARDTYKAVLDINPQHAQARKKYVELSKKMIMQ
ncbi:MAG: tetratricopeptide repeat protein [Deltaproteobacteria bacterium]|nr:tetratricopeptide repeat protein [Deltaproteobacteria bacterium]